MIDLSTTIGRMQFTEDVGAIRELAHSEPWKIFLRHAMEEMDAVKDQMITCSKDDFDRLRGTCLGMLALVRLPEKIINLDVRLKGSA